MKRLLIVSVLLSGPMISIAAPQQAASTSKTSGVYMTAADYQNHRLSFEGDCRAKDHKLELHDVLNRPYIHVTHESETRRYSKSEVFGFRACDGRDYRFGKNLEYEILEARELYIYSRNVTVSQGKTHRTVREYYFSVGAQGQIQSLTLENLKQAFPENHKFHDSLDATLAGRDVAQYDDMHKMFKVNRLLIASRER